MALGAAEANMAVGVVVVVVMVVVGFDDSPGTAVAEKAPCFPEALCSTRGDADVAVFDEEGVVTRCWPSLCPAKSGE